MKQYAVRVADGADFSDGLKRADFVVCVHNRNQRSVVPQGLLELLQADKAVAVHRQIGDLEALLFQGGTGMQNGVVLKLCCDNMSFALLAN